MIVGLNRVEPAPALASALTLLLVGAGAQAEEMEEMEEIEERLRVPVLTVNAGQQIAAEDIEEVVRGTGARAFFPQEVGEKLGLCAPVPVGFSERIKTMIATALDRFFSGELDGAEVKFAQVVGDLDDTPAAVSIDPTLREVSFKARLYLATISRGKGLQELTDELIAVASARFPELVPSPADFPPWVRDQLLALRDRGVAQLTKVSSEAPGRCDLVIGGRPVGSTALVTHTKGKKVSIQMHCMGKIGPPQCVAVAEKEIAVTPFVLGHTRLEWEAGEIELDARQVVDDSWLVQDLLILARRGGWSRMIALVGREDRIDVWLLDEQADRVVRRGLAHAGDSGQLQAAGASLLDSGSVPVIEEEEDPNWYENPLAWALLGTGAGALAAGLTMGKIFGTPSAQEPLAWALIGAGGGLMGTGVVTFFIMPPFPRVQGVEKERDRPVLGVTTSWSF